MSLLPNKARIFANIFQCARRCVSWWHSEKPLSALTAVFSTAYHVKDNETYTMNLLGEERRLSFTTICDRYLRNCDRLVYTNSWFGRVCAICDDKKKIAVSTNKRMMAYLENRIVYVGMWVKSYFLGLHLVGLKLNCELWYVRVPHSLK